jgi:hypothetical protein
MPLLMVAAIAAQGARDMTATNNRAAFSNDPTSLQAATLVVFRKCFTDGTARQGFFYTSLGSLEFDLYQRRLCNA